MSAEGWGGGQRGEGRYCQLLRGRGWGLNLSQAQQSASLGLTDRGAERESDQMHRRERQGSLTVRTAR